MEITETNLLELRNQAVKTAKEQIGLRNLLKPKAEYNTEYKNGVRVSVWKSKILGQSWYDIDLIIKHITIRFKVSQTELITIK